jgi:hypothetical protein
MSVAILFEASKIPLMSDSGLNGDLLSSVGVSNTKASVEVETASPLPPWSPWMAFVNVLLLGPIAGVLVTHFNLRRLGLAERSGTILWGGMLGAAVFALANTLTELPRLLNYVITLSWAYRLYTVQEPACSRWKRETSASYRSGWSALGWGVVGLLILVALFLLFDLAFSPEAPAD